MRYALGIEYDGKNYCGWQRQKSVVSVQQTLENALSKIADEPIEVVCAGRTDTGVNATNQVIHFDTSKVRKDVAWTLGVNTHLPSDIAVTWVKSVDDDFHARFSATARRYRYIIYNNTLRPAILSYGISHCHYPLNEKLMHEGAQYLVGKHDFTSFRTVHCQSHSPTRTIEHCQVTRQGEYIIVDIKANAFLHHMVQTLFWVVQTVLGNPLRQNINLQVVLSLQLRNDFFVRALPLSIPYFLALDPLALNYPQYFVPYGVRRHWL